MSITLPQGGSGDSDVEVDLEEPEFPLEELNRLDDMINKPRWVVPVLPKGELEVLLESSIILCKKGKLSSNLVRCVYLHNVLWIHCYF